MRLFGMRNETTVGFKDPDAAWRYTGGIGPRPTKSGVRVDYETAATWSAIFCGFRVISETIAMLPCSVYRNDDPTSKSLASSRPEHRIVHHQFNPFQTSLTAFDQMTWWLLGYGYAPGEVVWNAAGQATSVHPIHPSRIPKSHIVRSGPDGKIRWMDRTFDLREISMRPENNIVFMVRNNDGTVSPVPYEDMLLVPGIGPENGITGKSIIEYGANSIATAISTENSVASFMNRGMNANVVVSVKGIVNKDKIGKLRDQWAETYGGSDNAYKAIIMEEGESVHPLTVDPRAAQLVEARMFGTREAARWLRLPLHFLSGNEDPISGSTVEEENLWFLLNSAMIWIRRWETALNKSLFHRNLVHGRYECRFDLNAILRGNMKDRAEFYERMIRLGVMSINEVRWAEQMNGIENGDVHMVQFNNMRSLDFMIKQGDQELEQMAVSVEKQVAELLQIEQRIATERQMALTGQPTGEDVPEDEEFENRGRDRTSMLKRINTKAKMGTRTLDGIHEALVLMARRIDQTEKHQDRLTDRQEREWGSTLETLRELESRITTRLEERGEEANQIVRTLDERESYHVGQFQEVQGLLTSLSERIENVVSRDTAMAAAREVLDIQAEREKSREHLQGVVNATRASVQSALTGVLEHERQAVRRWSVESPSKFPTLATNFYKNFEDTLRRRLTPFESVMRELNIPFDPNEIARRHVENSVEALNPCLDVKLNELPNAVDGILRTWTDRAEKTASTIVTGTATIVPVEVN